MSRSFALSLAAATLIGCSPAPERPILSQFFSASRLRDSTMLALVAAVAFEPGTQGIVTSFDIVSVTPEQRRPLALTTYATAHNERVVVDMSINNGQTHVDVTKYDGEMISKEASISAPVKLPSGQTVQKNMVVTMQRAVLKGDKEITGQWIITAIKDASGSASTPRS